MPTIPDISGWTKTVIDEKRGIVQYAKTIENSGINVDTFLDIGVSHRLLRVIIHEWGAAIGTDTTDPFLYYIEAGHIPGSGIGLLRTGNTNGEGVIEIFGQCYEYPGIQYDIITNTTAGNLTEFKAVFEVLG